MVRKYFSAVHISLICLLLSACAGESSPQVQAMQRKDKQLSCKEVLLEMNEAQFYKKMAQKNKDPRLKTVLMPLGYISTYMGAEEAMETASARIDYLDKIYDIMDCDRSANNGSYQQPVAYQPSSTPPPSAYIGANYTTESNSYSPAQVTPSARYVDERNVTTGNQPQIAVRKSW